MTDNVRDRSGVRWLLAGAAALVTLVLLALVLGLMVPRQRGGAVVGGVDSDQLETACKMVSGDMAVLCQRVQRMSAAVDDGNCVAAEVHARPVLAAHAEPGGFVTQLQAYTRGRMDTCAKWERRSAQP